MTVHGDRHLQMPTAEFEFVSLGRVIVDQIPRPVRLTQLLGIVLSLPSDEIRQDTGFFDSEFEQCLQHSPPNTLKLGGILEGRSCIDKM